MGLRFDKVCLVMATLVASGASAGQEPVHLVYAASKGLAFEGDGGFPAGEYFAVSCAESCVLRKARLSVRGEEIQTYDGVQPGQVAWGSEVGALFFVRGVAGLREGPLATYFFNGAFARDPLGAIPRGPASATLSFLMPAGRADIVATVSRVADGSCAPLEPCPGLPRVRYQFRQGDTVRTLFTLTGSEFGEPLAVEDFLVWAGDLDGDGKPDLVVRPQDRPDYLELSLFLSSQRVKGRPWHRAARFYWWDPRNPGC